MFQSLRLCVSVCLLDAVCFEKLLVCFYVLYVYICVFALVSLCFSLYVCVFFVCLCLFFIQCNGSFHTHLSLLLGAFCFEKLPVPFLLVLNN